MPSGEQIVSYFQSSEGKFMKCNRVWTGYFGAEHKDCEPELRYLILLVVGILPIVTHSGAC